MRNSLAIALILVAACSPNSTRKPPAEGFYAEVGGSQILVFDETRFYSGPREVPSGSKILEDYGTPIAKHDSKDVRCVNLSPLVFAVAERPTYSCLGVVFKLQGVNPNGTRDILATCFDLKGDRCISEPRKTPSLQYQFTYKPKVGIESFRFVSDNPKVPGSILRHEGGAFILGDGVGGPN